MVKTRHLRSVQGWVGFTFAVPACNLVRIQKLHASPVGSRAKCAET